MLVGEISFVAVQQLSLTESTHRHALHGLFVRYGLLGRMSERQGFNSQEFEPCKVRTTWVSTHKTRSGLLAHVGVDRLECGHQGSGDAEHVPDEPGVQHDLERGIRNGVAKPDPHV